jgi:L-malate glycosyltransferase
MADVRRIALVAPIDLQVLFEALGHSAPEDVRGRSGAASVTTTLAVNLSELVALHVVADDTALGRPRRWQLGRHIVTVVPARASGFARDIHRHERASLKRAIEDVPVDILHAHWTYEYALAALRFRRRAPVVVSLHDWAPALLRLRPHPYNGLRLGMQAWVLPRASTLTVNSPYLASKLERVGLRAHLVPNPVPETSFDWSAPPGPDGPPVCLAVNIGFDRLKNVQKLLEAFSHVRRRREDAVLRLVGRPYGPGEAAETWAASRGLDANVDFVGPLAPSEVRRELKSATILVHPSREESFGQVLVEAMAVGTPVVGGARSGAVPWVLADGQAGRLVDVTDAHSLAGGILRALDDPRLQVEGARGRQITWDRFRPSVVTAKLLDVYEQVLRA